MCLNLVALYGCQQRDPGQLPCLDGSLYAVLETVDPGRSGTEQWLLWLWELCGFESWATGLLKPLLILPSMRQRGSCPGFGGSDLEKECESGWGGVCQLPLPRRWVQDARLPQLLLRLKALFLLPSARS